MAWQQEILLPQDSREGRLTVRLHIETDSLARRRLRLAWLTAINAVAVANDCPSYTLVFRVARLQAQKALELYFDEVESCLKQDI